MDLVYLYISFSHIKCLLQLNHLPHKRSSVLLILANNFQVVKCGHCIDEEFSALRILRADCCYK